jgi:propionyl-CoA synthetase
MSYLATYRAAQEDPAGFWLDKAQLIEWDVKPSLAVAKDDAGNERWFSDGMMNTCFNVLDRHVRDGRGQQAAIYYDSPVTGTKQCIAYGDLLERVEKAAGGLKHLGVGRGDRVVIYMPMVPEAIIAMLACARLGAIHSVVFGGFAAPELAVRLTDATPKVLITATCGIEVDRVVHYMPIVNAALEQTEATIDRVIVLDRPESPLVQQPERDLSWHRFMQIGKPAACTPVAATDPLYVLYTSGTTGKPKGVVRDNGGHAVALAWSMSAVYDVAPGDVFWAASDIGWVVGHSYIVYAPLLMGCTTVLYEGKPVKTPDAAAFWRVVSDYRVRVLFAAPTAFRAIRKEDPAGNGLADYDLDCLKALFLAGERLDPPTLNWLESLTDCPVVDHWWQTETGWAIAGNPLGIERLEPKPGSATKPLPGYLVEILDPEGLPMPAGEQGAVVIKRPLPPACLPTLWQDHERFEQAYFNTYPGYYLTGDGGYIDADGYLFIMGRTDDVINVAGHRLSTGEMEEVVAAHAAVAECAVVGVQDGLKGQVPVGLVVLKDGVEVTTATIENELIQQMREAIGAVASFRRVLVVNRLPKTRSGKILRGTLRAIADGAPFTPPSTIEDPAVLDEMVEALARPSP